VGAGVGYVPESRCGAHLIGERTAAGHDDTRLSGATPRLSARQYLGELRVAIEAPA